MVLFSSCSNLSHSCFSFHSYRCTTFMVESPIRLDRFIFVVPSILHVILYSGVCSNLIFAIIVFNVAVVLHTFVQLSLDFSYSDSLPITSPKHLSVPIWALVSCFALVRVIYSIFPFHDLCIACSYLFYFDLPSCYFCFLLLYSSCLLRFFPSSVFRFPFVHRLRSSWRS